MADVMRIRKRRLGFATLLDLGARDLLSEACGDTTIKHAVTQLTARGRRRIVVNLHGISHIDSSGLRMLLAARSAAAERGAQLGLVGATPRVREVLAVTRLDTVFHLYENEHEAATSAGASR
jgi:anti-sigma B factor antagonist